MADYLCEQKMAEVIDPKVGFHTQAGLLVAPQSDPGIVDEGAWGTD